MGTIKREVKLTGLTFRSMTFKEKVTKKDEFVEVILRVKANTLPVEYADLNGNESRIKSVELSLALVDRIVLESERLPQMGLDLIDDENKKKADAEKIKKHTRPATDKEKAEAKKNTEKVTAKKAADKKKPVTSKSKGPKIQGKSI
jgi:hypothetical protein